MKDVKFYQYLTEHYRGSRSCNTLGNRAAADAVSRGNRIERTLKIDLDSSLTGLQLDLNDLLGRIERNKASFKIRGSVAKGILSIKNAAKGPVKRFV